MRNKITVLYIPLTLFGITSCQLMSFLSNPAAAIKEELLLHNASIANRTMRECTWRPVDMKAVCPDEDIKTILYTSNGRKAKRELVDAMQDDWLRQSAYDPDKEDILLIHGYAGGDDTLPIAVLRDAYLANGSYNVWMLDWGPLCQPPCYPAAVHNIKAVAKCTGELLMTLRRAGLRTEKLTCVGHSLGAHTCGLIAKHVQFRLHRIVALDPARPLLPAASRLANGHAGAVHVVHTNAGHYGEAGRSGHADFCINGGRIQPYCENAGYPPFHHWMVRRENDNTIVAPQSHVTNFFFRCRQVSVIYKSIQYSKGAEGGGDNYLHRRHDVKTCILPHTCGLIEKHVQFRLYHIVALDPTRPLLPAASRLANGHAGAAHVVHTNAGHYGEAGRSDHVDFCINGGWIRPYYENAGFDVNLCSHVWAICYMAESLHPSLARKAEPCSRRCPTGPRPGHRIGIPVLLGQFTPLKVSGSYCAYTDDPPYCPKKPGDLGDLRCCLRAPDYEVTESVDEGNEGTQTQNSFNYIK